MAGHDRPLAGRRRFAATEGFRSAPDLVGSRPQTGPLTVGRTQYFPALCGRATGGAVADHESARCRQRDAARHLPDDLPPEPEGDHLYRPEIALWLYGLVAYLALRQQRARSIRRQGRALGLELLYRPRAIDRGRVSRRQHSIEIAD